MKIVIAGGDTKAEYIIRSFKDRHNELIVINPSLQVVERLRKACFVKAYHGEPWSRITLEQCDVFDADIFVSLCERDTDNYAACLMAKRMFNVKKTICVVDNPSNVELFKKLGLDSVISSTYLLGQSIMSESSVETLTKTLSLDDNRVTVVEKVLLSKYEICHKAIRDIRFPKYASIAAVYRNFQVIIPSGSVVLEPKDTLIMVTTPSHSKTLLKYLETEVSSSERRRRERLLKRVRASEEPAEEEAASTPKPVEETKPKPRKKAQKPAETLVEEPKPEEKPTAKPAKKPAKPAEPKPEPAPAKPTKKPGKKA